MERTPPAALNKYCNVAEAAEELGVAVQRVYQMIDEGKLDWFVDSGQKKIYRTSILKEQRRLDAKRKAQKEKKQ